MFQNSLAISKKNHKNRYSNDKDNLEIRRVAIKKGRPADPGREGSTESGGSNVIRV